MATYRVTNTRNVPKGARILEYEGKDYFEGDMFVPPVGASKSSIKALVDLGILVEVG